MGTFREEINGPKLFPVFSSFPSKEQLKVRGSERIKEKGTLLDVVYVGEIWKNLQCVLCSETKFSEKTFRLFSSKSLHPVTLWKK